ncbi:GNAT superfamily N-acetyltransferase [Agromyces flavus]|uniref:GNAT superfamily N-acetyltransferase n=1 Tax=Agromyces flavus TaxID=589382 RepID=A0A1H1WHJ2_9MICO|nr:GNAT family N-acetyltransferase [Agromyces flavus]MCP2366165.1 GNAT superfamily N-acetyltransferase [Agromyces flavus]GGI44130.1 N-acetyltransferase [Agromyces flavus]SDS96110.1 Predicted N-acetyltransferase YhbS [Agromyces flavus]
MSSDRIQVSGETYLFRRARSEDVRDLIALLAADSLRASEFGSGDADQAAYMSAFEVIDADAAQLLVAVEGPDARIVGTMQLTFIPGLSRGGATRMQVEAVRVADDHRGNGLGSAMIRWAVDLARERGARLVQLTSDARRADAHRFYERLGFDASHVGFKLFL